VVKCAAGGLIHGVLSVHGMVLSSRVRARRCFKRSAARVTGNVNDSGSSFSPNLL
jgi:hypothetical protein